MLLVMFSHAMKPIEPRAQQAQKLSKLTGRASP